MTSSPFWRTARRALLALALGLAAATAPAESATRAEPDFLPPEQAYEYAVEADGTTLVVTYNIRDGYFLYRKKLAFATATPGVELGAAAYPPALNHHDDYFGDQEIYRHLTAIRIPYQVTGARPSTIDLTLKLQGCADAGLCYPPQTWTAHVALPAGAAAGAPSRPGGLADRLLKAKTASDDGFLPVEAAYQVSASPAGADRIRVRFVIADGYYLYRNRMGVATDDTRLELGALELPTGLPHEDDYFGKQEIYRQQVEALVPVTRRAGAAGAYQIKLRYQGCADAGLCYPPQTTLLSVSLPGGGAGLAGTAGGSPPRGGASGAAGAADAAATSLLATLVGFALLGGLLLNLMPCVLPVLSIKAVSLAASSASDAAGTRAKGFAYTAGVMLSMLALAGALLALRAAGAQIGWGFQLQSPRFVLGLCYLLLLVGLNLSGVFEVGGSLAGAGDDLARGDTVRASFFTGVLTTLVATPCTAPFMATAVGVALTQSAGTALAVFAALGLGLALPYLWLSLVPAARRFLPRPGAWMTRFKQALAFPMYASAGWMLWVLAQQASPQLLAVAILGLVLVALAAWCYEIAKGAAGTWRVVTGIVAIAALGAGVAAPFAVDAARAAHGEAVAADGWVPFTPAHVESLVAKGAPVLVVFTADWCVTCKVNEHVAIEAADVERLLEQKGVVKVKADWTNQDAAISAELARHGRAGVPLYLFYRPGVAEPVILPQILTPGMLQDLVVRLPDRAGGPTRS